MPGEISVSSLAAANPRHFSPRGSCSTMLGFVRPLRGAVANLLPPRRRPNRAERLCRREVDLRGGEVGHTARVVQVQMRDDDVPHVISRKAQPVDLVDDGFVVVEDRPDHVPGRPNPLGIVAVMRAVATVNQDESVVGFDQQHVADHRCGRHVHGAAVEVVNLHASGTPRRAASNCSTSSRAAARSSWSSSTRCSATPRSIATITVANPSGSTDGVTSPALTAN